MHYMLVHVETFSGYKEDERPVAFLYHAKRHEISDITDRWYEGNVDSNRAVIHYYKVVTLDGSVFLLRHIFEPERWELFHFLSKL